MTSVDTKPPTPVADVAVPSPSPSPSGCVGTDPATPTQPPRDWRAALSTAAVLVTVLWWLTIAARNWGGRGPDAVTVGSFLILVAALLSRPDRALGLRPLLIAGSLTAGVLAVCLFSTTGWAGATVGATYVAAAWLTIIVAAEVRGRSASLPLLMAVVCLATLVEFTEAWSPWHGGQDPAMAMTGTFYWHNQFAIFLLPGALIGLSAWFLRRGAVALGGLLTFVLAVVGVVYSTSRASLACLALGVVLVVAGQLRAHPSWITAARGAAAIGLGTLATWTVAGPPFFPHRVAVLAGTQQRAAGQSLSQNGGYRLDFWREALAVFHHHPLVGGGFRSLATAGAGLVPASWPVSPLAHNGYLQALSDGGLVLGVPLLVAAVLLGARATITLAGAFRRGRADLLSLAIPVSLGALIVHSAIDFDWSYAAGFAMSAVLAGAVLGARPPDLTEPSAGPAVTGSHALPRRVIVVLGVVALAGFGWAARGGQLDLSVHSTHTATSSGDTR